MFTIKPFFWFTLAVIMVVGVVPSVSLADDTRHLVRISGAVVLTDVDVEDGRYLVASSRHGHKHYRQVARHEPPYGRAYGYYGKHKHKHNCYCRVEVPVYRRYRSGDYAPIRTRFPHRHQSRVGISACLTGSDGYFCFNSR